MTSGMQPAPVASPTRQRVASWIALALTLVYPLTIAWNASTITPEDLSHGGNFVLMALYNALLFIEWPLPIFATFLAGLALRDSRGGNRIAWTALILGALTLLVMVGAVAFVAFFAQGQSASSMVAMMRG